MKLFVPAVVAAVFGQAFAAGGAAKAVEPDSLPRRTGDCGSRDECMLLRGSPGHRLSGGTHRGSGDFRCSRIQDHRDSGGRGGSCDRRPDARAADADIRRSCATTLKAPASGLVTRSTAAIAATASPAPGEPLFRIAIDNEIELEADIPSIHVPMLASGQSARVQLDDGRELYGRVRLVPAAVDQRTQLGRARVSLERASGPRLGMFARATIDANRSCGISVPRSAVTYRTEGTSVQIVRNDVIATRKVRIGFHSDDDIEIRDGLREGDTVVANAGSSLRDGDRSSPSPTPRAEWARSAAVSVRLCCPAPIAQAM